MAKKPLKKTPAPKKQPPLGKSTAGGFTFADPRPSPDDFDEFNPKDVLADTNVKAATRLQPVPKPSKNPPVMDLTEVLSAADVQQISDSKSITFHSVGDTGGIKEPSKQFAVADAMAADLDGKTYSTGRPAFFYHLGDVVYYLGEEQYYYDQFYDPYRDYDAPIFAIPGNHDGMVSQSLKQKTLDGFNQNFCTKAPSPPPHGQGHARSTMTQPGVYFTLNAPFVKIIGLYSNISEGATEGVISGNVVGPAQLSFLQQQLTAAASQRQAGPPFALVIAVHHPPFTGSEDHAPSPTMLKEIDSACQKANILPDLVLSGHAHLYERYTRNIGGHQIPFLVAGCGGYFNLSGFKKGKHGGQPKTPVSGRDGSGNSLTLEKYDDTTFGFLRLTISSAEIAGQFVGVDVTSRAVSVRDSFSLDLKKNSVRAVR